MIDFGHNILTGEKFRQIEDIIDARKLLGQYNVHKQSNNATCRYAYSHSSGTLDTGRVLKYDDNVVTLNEGNNLNNLNIKQTDSEITVVRVKRRKVTLKNRLHSRWDMHDIAIPGDGCHLGDSPSMVNLVTLVGYNVPCEGEEYLVPLSSWEPYPKHEEISSDLKYYSESCLDIPNTSKKNVKFEDCNTLENTFSKLNLEDSEDTVKDDGIDLVFRRPSLAGRISKFIRKHCKKQKTLSELPDQFQSKN